MPAPRTLLWLTAAYLGAGVAVAAVWQMTGSFEPMMWYFRVLGAVFLVGVAAAELAIARRLRLRFEPGDMVRPAWLFVTAGATLRLSGMVIAHGLATELSPGHRLGVRLSEGWREFGIVLAGPAHLLMIVLALGVMLVACRRAGLEANFRASDVVLLALVAAWTVFEIGALVPVRLGQSPRPTPAMWAQWLTDPILSVLLAFAILLRRVAQTLRGGLIAKCFTSYVVAVFLTAIGNLTITLVAYEYIPWPWNAATWYIWYPVATCFALGPAYYLAAMGTLSRPAVEERASRTV